MERVQWVWLFYVLNIFLLVSLYYLIQICSSRQMASPPMLMCPPQEFGSNIKSQHILKLLGLLSFFLCIDISSLFLIHHRRFKSGKFISLFIILFYFNFVSLG